MVVLTDASTANPGAELVALRSEAEFVLPLGYVDPAGVIHRTGRMRLATARDELSPLVDPRVVRNLSLIHI